MDVHIWLCCYSRGNYVVIKEGDFCLTMSDYLHYINGLWFLYLSKAVLVVIAMLHYSSMGTYIITTTLEAMVNIAFPVIDT